MSANFPPRGYRTCRRHVPVWLGGFSRTGPIHEIDSVAIISVCDQTLFIMINSMYLREIVFDASSWFLRRVICSVTSGAMGQSLYGILTLPFNVIILLWCTYRYNSIICMLPSRCLQNFFLYTHMRAGPNSQS